MSNRKKSNKSKDVHGSIIRRSEYDDGILQSNKRTGNRLRAEMQFQERAQKVIMRDLGKESLLLQTKLGKDRKSPSFGLYGSKFGTTTSSVRRYASTSPIGKALTSSSFKSTTNSNTETKFPWDKDYVEKDNTTITFDRESALSNRTTPVNMKSGTSRFRTPSLTAYPVSRGQPDDFLANILNEAMNDELLYTQNPEMRIGSSAKTEIEMKARSPVSMRRKMKTPRGKIVPTPRGSIVNGINNVHETEPLMM